jgi:hypothetical protein
MKSKIIFTFLTFSLIASAQNNKETFESDKKVAAGVSAAASYVSYRTYTKNQAIKQESWVVGTLGKLNISPEKRVQVASEAIDRKVPSAQDEIRVTYEVSSKPQGILKYAEEMGFQSLKEKAYAEKLLAEANGLKKEFSFTEHDAVFASKRPESYSVRNYLAKSEKELKAIAPLIQNEISFEKKYQAIQKYKILKEQYQAALSRSTELGRIQADVLKNHKLYKGAHPYALDQVAFKNAAEFEAGVKKLAKRGKIKSVTLYLKNPENYKKLSSKMAANNILIFGTTAVSLLGANYAFYDYVSAKIDGTLTNKSRARFQGDRSTSSYIDKSTGKTITTTKQVVNQ